MTNGAPSMHGRQRGNFSVVYHLSMDSNWYARDAGKKFLPKFSFVQVGLNLLSSSAISKNRDRWIS